MFSVHYNQSFFDAYFDDDKPAFVKIKSKDDLPSFSYVNAGFDFSNLSGIPISHNGKVVTTANYKITLKCDVCEQSVATKTMKGAPQEYTLIPGSVCDINFEISLHDKELLKKAPTEILFRQFYHGQCARCGRWIANGKEHKDCFDTHYGCCKYCAEITNKLLHVKK